MEEVTRPSLQNTPSAAGGQASFLVLAATVLAGFVRFGYLYATGDQDEILPYVMHLLDPALFNNDLFVQQLGQGISVRAYSAWLIEGLALVMPPWSAVLLLHIATWVLIAAGVFRIALGFTRDRTAAAAATFAALVLTPTWTLGANDLAGNLLGPSTIAVVPAVWAFAFFMDRRVVTAGVLLGISTWFQALVGMQTALILGAYLLSMFVRRSHRAQVWKPLWTFSASYLIAALPMLVPIALEQLGPEPSAGTGPDTFYIISAFRLPHH